MVNVRRHMRRLAQDDRTWSSEGIRNLPGTEAHLACLKVGVPRPLRRDILGDMPIQPDGHMSVQYHGTTPNDWLLDKIAQMRRDMHHINNALSVLEGQARRKADPG